MLADSVQKYVLDTAYLIALEHNQGMVPPESINVRLDFFSKLFVLLTTTPEIENDNRIRNLITAINQYERNCDGRVVVSQRTPKIV